jgi:hypothetical protein
VRHIETATARLGDGPARAIANDFERTWVLSLCVGASEESLIDCHDRDNRLDAPGNR